MTVPAQRAREILLNWEPYRSMSPWEIGLRVDVPLHLGFAEILDDAIFYSWSRIPKGNGAFQRLVRGDWPRVEDWSMDGPIMWLVDVAAVPGYSAVRLARKINRRMLEQGRGVAGERALFRRHCGRRYGWAVAQEIA